MQTPIPSDDREARDALPGYEVIFFCHRTGTTASIFEVAYPSGRRLLLSRHNWRLRPIDRTGPAVENVHALVLELAELLGDQVPREAGPGAPGGGGGR